MEQKDFILREIEKIGKIISAIRKKLFGGKENAFSSSEKQYNDLSEMLLREVNFDLENLLSLDLEKAEEYLGSFRGLNVEGIEQLADIISEIGFTNSGRESAGYLEKAVQLYDLCNVLSKTYSLERETKIAAIKKAL